MGILTIFVTALLSTLSWVFTVTTRTVWSFPGWTAMMRPMFRCVGGRWGVSMVTRSPSSMFEVDLNHFDRLWSVDRYSTVKRYQNDWYNCQRVRRFIVMFVISFSGRAHNCCPIKKWPGVSAQRSFGSPDNGVKGLEFNIPSIRIIKVWNSSPVNICWPITFLRWDFVLFMAASHRPPKCGAAGGLKCQVHGILDVTKFWVLE